MSTLIYTKFERLGRWKSVLQRQKCVKPTIERMRLVDYAHKLNYLIFEAATHYQHIVM